MVEIARARYLLRPERFAPDDVDHQVSPVVKLNSTKLPCLLETADWVAEAYFTFVEGLRWLARHDPELTFVNNLLPECHLLDLSHFQSS